LRNILLSFMVIGVAAALVSGATFAPFTDSGAATRVVTIGAVTLLFDGEDSAETPLPFDVDLQPYCPDNLAPGDSCSATVTIANPQNSNSLAAVMSAPVATITSVTINGLPAPDCSADDWLLTAVIADTNEGESNTLFPPGDAHELLVQVTLLAGSGTGFSLLDEGCQGATANVTVTVQIEQSPDPHSTDDTDPPGGG
jgi:hypothetical protein